MAVQNMYKFMMSLLLPLNIFIHFWIEKVYFINPTQKITELLCLYKIMKEEHNIKLDFYGTVSITRTFNTQITNLRGLGSESSHRVLRPMPHLADQENILALLASWSFDRKPTAECGNFSIKCNFHYKKTGSKSSLSG